MRAKQPDKTIKSPRHYRTAAESIEDLIAETHRIAGLITRHPALYPQGRESASYKALEGARRELGAALVLDAQARAEVSPPAETVLRVVSAASPDPPPAALLPPAAASLFEEEEKEEPPALPMARERAVKMIRALAPRDESCCTFVSREATWWRRVLQPVEGVLTHCAVPDCPDLGIWYLVREDRQERLHLCHRHQMLGADPGSQVGYPHQYPIFKDLPAPTKLPIYVVVSRIQKRVRLHKPDSEAILQTWDDFAQDLIEGKDLPIRSRAFPAIGTALRDLAAHETEQVRKYLRAVEQWVCLPVARQRAINDEQDAIHYGGQRGEPSTDKQLRTGAQHGCPPSEDKGEMGLRIQNSMKAKIDNGEIFVACYL